MGRQLNQIIEGLAGVTSGTSTINANLDAIDALLSTLQADIADGIIVSSGTANTNLRDGSGNAITSTTLGASRRLDVMLSSGGATGSAAPTDANLVGGTDGTNLRGIRTDTSGRVSTQIFDSSGTALTYAATGTAGTPSSDVISVQGISGGTPLPVRPRNAAVTVTAGTTSGTANTSAQALASSSTRQYLLIQNISDTDMYFNFGAAATTSNLLVKSGGAGITFESGFVPTDAVNVICSAASKSYYILSA